MRHPSSAFALLALLALAACSSMPRAAGTAAPPPAIPAAASTIATAPSMNQVAESYVKLALALALGVHDPDYVDAYYGPPALRAALAAIPVVALDTMSQLRHEYLGKQLQAMAARVDVLRGKRLAFDDESRVLYRLPRGLSRPPRLQRAAREAPVNGD